MSDTVLVDFPAVRRTLYLLELAQFSIIFDLAKYFDYVPTVLVDPLVRHEEPF